MSSNPNILREEWDALTPDEQWTTFYAVNHMADELHDLLKLIPPCSVHGDQCIAHAKDWIKAIQNPLVAVAKSPVPKERPVPFESYEDDDSPLDTEWKLFFTFIGGLVVGVAIYLVLRGLFG